MKTLEEFLLENKHALPIYIRLNNKLIASAYTKEQVKMLTTVLAGKILTTTNYAYTQSYVALTLILDE